MMEARETSNHLRSNSSNICPLTVFPTHPAVGVLPQYDCRCGAGRREDIVFLKGIGMPLLFDNALADEFIPDR